MKETKQTRERELELLEPILGRRAAENLLARFTLLQILQTDENILQKVPLVGPSTTRAIKALPRLFEICCRSENRLGTISSSKDVFDLYRFRMGHEEKEKFIVLALNSRNRIVAEDTAAMGSVNTVHVSPADILKTAIRHSAVSIICLHNHPSQDPTPSPEDRRLTERICRASSLLGIRLLDHMIITLSSYYSFSDSGEL